MAMGDIAREPAAGPESGMAPIREPAEPLYRIVLNLALVAIFLIAVSFALFTAFTWSVDWLTSDNVSGFSSDLLYIALGLWSLTEILTYCAASLAAIYLIGRLDWKAFAEKAGLRFDRSGLRLFAAGVLLAVAAGIATFGIALLTGCISYVDNGISMAYMLAEGYVFYGRASPGLIDQLPPLSVIVSSAMFIAIALATAFGEQALVRGYLQRSLTPKYGGFTVITTIALVSSLPFILMGVSLLCVIDSFFVSVLLGYLYLMTRSLLLPMGFQFASIFLTMEYTPAEFSMRQLLYVYFDPTPIKLAGIPIGSGYLLIGTVVTFLLLVLLWYYNEKRRNDREEREQ